MRAAIIALVVLAAGCKTGDDDTDTWTHDFESHHSTTTPDTAPPGTTEPTVTVPDGLHGVPPDENLPLPDFSEVVSRDGTLASPQDLVGKPTILWFYPAAFTGG
ncbi:MAG: hypothetical protein R3F59_20085 [Myxococcota bacterium]